MVLKRYREYRKRQREETVQRSENANENDGSNPNNHESFVRMSEDFPYRVRNVRKKLIPFLRNSLSEGKQAFLKYDQLCVDGELYTYSEESKSPVLVEK